MIRSAGWGLDQRATRLGSAHLRRRAVCRAARFTPGGGAFLESRRGLSTARGRFRDADERKVGDLPTLMLARAVSTLLRIRCRGGAGFAHPLNVDRLVLCIVALLTRGSGPSRIPQECRPTRLMEASLLRALGRPARRCVPGRMGHKERAGQHMPRSTTTAPTAQRER
jgi:hypothetical protein